MKCKFCKQPAGFMKGYHKECRKSADNTLKQIEAILNKHNSDDVVSKEVKKKIKEIALSNVLYKNYVESRLIDKTQIYINEVVIYAESEIKISESKNRCKMIETGYCYEKMPTWSEKQLLLDNSGTVVFTDEAIYLYVSGKTMRYPYKKIVNYGYDKIWTLQYTYFDIKTSSPFPHRFSLTDAFKAKDGVK